MIKHTAQPVLATIVFSLFLTAHSTAQEKTPSPNDELSEIVVTATRTATPVNETVTAISRIEGDLVQLGQPQLGLDEALNRVPGLFLQNRFNFAQDLRISNRGFGARASFGIRGIRILVDGIPATLADGQGSVDAIDLGSVSHIEVLRGPASALFGNAAGGVIAIESEVGADTPYIEARAAIGEYGYDKTQLKMAGQLGDLGLLASLAHVDVDGYRDFSQARNSVANIKARYKMGGDEGNTVINVSLSHTDQPEANDPGGINLMQAQDNPRSARDRNVQLGAGEDLDERRAGASLVHRNWFRSDDLFTLKAHTAQRDFAGFIPTGDGAIGFDRSFAGFGAQYEIGQLTGENTHRIVAGIDTENQRDERERFQNLNGTRGELLLQQTEKVDNLGVYLQDTIAVTPSTKLVLGLRHDRIQFELTDRFLQNGDASAKRTLSHTSPVVGVSWIARPNLSVYFNRATSFETPTTTELAVASGGFNSELEPQLATSYEIGVRGDTTFAHVPLNFSVSLYDLSLEDELIPIEQIDGSDLFINAGKSSRRGLELDSTLNFSEFLSMHFAYTWSDFKFDSFVDSNGNDFANNRTPGTPEHAATLSFDYRDGQGRFVSLDVDHVGEIELNNANTQQSDDHVVMSIRAGFSSSLGRWRISPFVGVNNLGNTRYFSNTRINAFGNRFFEPGPERNVYGGVTLRYEIDTP